MIPNTQTKLEAGKLLRIPSLKDNFGLTKSDFLNCIENMKNGDDSFITHNMVHQLPESMIYLQNRFQISKELAYDTCMDTFLIFREKMLDNKISYGNLRYLFTRMCQNQFIDGQKKKKKIQSAIDSFHEESLSQELDKETFYLNLDKAIKQLPEEQSKLLTEFYYSGKSMADIAIEQNISYEAIRKKKGRILQKLKGLYFNNHNIEKDV